MGHWKRECPLLNSPPDHNTQNVFTRVSRGSPAAEVYLNVTVKDRSYNCLVDTGCETPLIPWKLVSSEKLSPAAQRVFAADGGELRILGKIYVHFMIDNLPMSAMFLVSDDIEEMMLGIDWLADHQCKWDIGAGVLYLGHHCLKLSSRASRVMCRRVYTAEDVLVPPASRNRLED